MNEIYDFLLKNWMLCGLLALTVVAYIIYEFTQDMNSNEISAAQAVALINHENAVVIDVRTQMEFDTGHILGAVHFDCNDADLKIQRLNKYTSQPVVVVCAHGKRSAKFLTRLEAQGFADAVSLAGGLQAWQDAGLPLSRR